DCMNGIGGTQAVRGTNEKTGLPYNLQNLYVHNNTITQQSGYAAGIVKSSRLDDSIFTSWNNRFVDNAYHLGSMAGRFFAWLNSAQTLATWQGHSWAHETLIEQH
ncbi:MAG TPA: hypothetical protein VNM47_06880, partial [Terriglobia bacterium]|nr:hypothetical protein [Terriglobia bacterium]